MANVYATKSGSWSDVTVWNTGALPATADDVYTNTFTVTANSSTRVLTVRNTSAAGITAGGSFVLANGVSLSCVSPLPLVTYPATLLTLVPAATASFYGIINGNVASSPAPVIVPSNSTFTLYGSAYNGTANTLSGNIVNFGTTNIFGDVLSPNGGQGGNVNSTVVLNCNQLNIVGRVNSNACGNDPSKGHISNVGTTTVNITGNVVLQYASFRCFCLFNPTNVNIIGSVTALGSQNQTAAIQGASIVNIRGNVSGPVFRSVTTANLTGSVIGDIYGNMESVTNFNMVNGNIFASTVATPVFAANATLLNVDLYATNAGHAISCTTSLTGTNCNVINAPNGRQSIYAPKVLMFPGASATYTRQAVNGYGSYADYWTSNATFTYPTSSDVALGTTYSNGTLSGSMVLPSPSSVALGALVGTTTGTASMTLDSVLSQPISNLTTPNSIGARLKNITTSQALSAIVDSLEF